MVKKFIYPKCEIFRRCFKDKFPLEQKKFNGKQKSLQTQNVFT